MKKQIGTLLIVASLFCFSPIVKSLPYLGLDFQWRSVSLSGLNLDLISRKSPAFNIYSGFSINEDFSVEAGFHSSKSNYSGSSLKMKGIHGTLIGYYPMNKEKSMKALAGIGFTQLKHTSKHPAYRLDLSRAAPRLMAGMEYDFTPNLAFRAAFVWESSKSFTQKPEKFNRTYGLSTGLKVKF